MPFPLASRLSLGGNRRLAPAFRVDLAGARSEVRRRDCSLNIPRVGAVSHALHVELTRKLVGKRRIRNHVNGIDYRIGLKGQLHAGTIRDFHFAIADFIKRAHRQHATANGIKRRTSKAKETCRLAFSKRFFGLVRDNRDSLAVGQQIQRRILRL